MGKARFKGNFAELAVALKHQLLRVLHPPPQNVAMDRDAHRRLEPGPQMRAADTGLAAENVDGERLVEI